MKRSSFLWVIVPVLLVGLICTMLFIPPSPLGIWISGISYIANHTDEYDYFSTSLDDVVEFSIDFKNLDSNIGKTIYEKDGCKIEIYDIEKTTDNYIVLFKSYGTYSKKSATLISGVKHSRTTNNSFTYNCCALLQLKNENGLYDCSVSGVSGLNHKYGDIFGYYVFHNEHLHQQESYEILSIDEAFFCMSGLVKNEWMVK